MRIARVKILKQQIHKLKLKTPISVKQNIIHNFGMNYAKISDMINKKNYVIFLL